MWARRCCGCAGRCWTISRLRARRSTPPFCSPPRPHRASTPRTPRGCWPSPRGPSRRAPCWTPGAPGCRPSASSRSASSSPTARCTSGWSRGSTGTWPCTVTWATPSAGRRPPPGTRWPRASSTRCSGRSSPRRSGCCSRSCWPTPRSSTAAPPSGSWARPPGPRGRRRRSPRSAWTTCWSSTWAWRASPRSSSPRSPSGPCWPCSSPSCGRRGSTRCRRAARTCAPRWATCSTRPSCPRRPSRRPSASPTAGATGRTSPSWPRTRSAGSTWPRRCCCCTATWSTRGSTRSWATGTTSRRCSSTSGRWAPRTGRPSAASPPARTASCGSPTGS
mmetsp:Transcript_14702/g.23903  ORF Transcript_14702/g.23903 Transcript_14702/m.23903 type:complete len:333 (-) Transcript_14702:455-1453(-)